jgi:nitroreductase family protein
MTADTSFTVNPLAFGYAADAGGVTGSAVEIAEFFLEPHTVEEGIAAGFAPAEIECACSTGVVVPTGSSYFRAARLWEDRGWSRAAFLMQSQLHRDPAVPVQETPPDAWRPAAISQISLPAVDISAPASLDALVRRRTCRSFADRPLGLEAFSEVLLRVGGAPSWLDVFVVIQRVGGIDQGVYRYEPADHRLDLARATADEAGVLAAVNFQPWVAGSGACAFLVVQWGRYSALHPGSRAYIDLLIQVGELAQEFLHAVYHVRAGAWGTPALHETASRKLLGIEQPGIDALYAIKFGPVPAGETAG